MLYETGNLYSAMALTTTKLCIIAWVSSFALSSRPEADEVHIATDAHFVKTSASMDRRDVSPKQRKVPHLFREKFYHQARLSQSAHVPKTTEQGNDRKHDTPRLANQYVHAESDENTHLE